MLRFHQKIGNRILPISTFTFFDSNLREHAYRNVLVESARIARGNIKPIENLHASNFDALVIPGGNFHNFSHKKSKILSIFYHFNIRFWISEKFVININEYVSITRNALIHCNRQLYGDNFLK